MADAKVVVNAIDNTKGAFQSIKASLNGLDTDVTKLTAGLGALAAAAGAVAIAAVVSDTIKAAAALSDLSTITGASVESLSKFSSVAKLSGTDIDSIANSMNKLAKNMAGASEEGKGASAALRAIGVDFTTFSRMSPEEKMLALARALDQFKDGSDKSAVAMALLGKEGARLLPFFKDLASAGDLQAKITTRQAEQSKQLDDNLKRLSASGDAWKKELAAGMTPALNTAAQALTDVISGTGGVREGVRKLSQDGTIAEWTRGAIAGLTYLMDTVQVLVRVFGVAGKFIYEALSAPLTLLWGSLKAMAKAASGDMAGAAKELSNAFSDVGAGWSEAWKQMEDAIATPTLGSKLRERMSQLEKTGEAAKKAKKDMQFDANADESNKKYDEQLKSLIKSIQDKTAVSDAEIAQQAKLTDGEKLAVTVREQLRNGTIKLKAEDEKLVDQLLDHMVAREKVAIVEERARKALAEAVKAHEDLIRELDDGTKKIRDETDAQVEHNTAMLLGKEAAAELAAAKLEEKAASLEALAMRKVEKDLDYGVYQLYLDQAKALRELAAVKRQGGAISDQIKEFKNVFDSIDQTAHDVFTDVFHSGSDAFKRLGQTLKASLLDLLYQMTVRPWIINIVTSLTGTNAGIAQAALGGGSGGGLSNLLGIGNLFGGGGGFSLPGVGSLSGGGLLGSIGSSLGLATGAGGSFASTVGAGLATDALGATVAEGAAAATLGAGGAMAAIGTALPYVGIALMAGQALGLFGKSHGPKTESGFGAGMRAGNDSSGAAAIAQGIQAQYAQLADLLGVSGSAIQNLGVFYAKDPNGTAQTQLQIAGGSYSRAAMYGGNFENVGRSDAEFQQAVQLASAQLIIKNLQEAAGGKIGDFLRGMDVASASLDQLNSALEVAQNVGTFERAVAALGPQFRSLTQMSIDGEQALIKYAGSVQNLTSQLSAYFNDFASDTEKRNALAQQISDTLTAGGLSTSVDQVLAMTREQYKNWVQYSMSMGDAGARTLATLLNVEQAFNQLQPAAESGVNGALTALARAVDAEKKSAQAVRDAAQERARDIGAVFDTLKSGVDNLYGQVDSTVRMRASRAQEFIARALQAERTSGYLPDNAQLQDAISAATSGIANTVYASVKDREFATLSLAGQLSELKAAAGGQLTDAQRQLQTAQAQLDSLDQILANAQQQVDALNGVDNSVKSVAAALSDLAAAIAGEKGAGGLEPAPLAQMPSAPSASPSSAPSDAAPTPSAPRTWLSRIGEDGWEDAGGGMVRNATTGGQWVPAFASGGWHDGGVALVGENGPEIAAFPPSRIFNARDTQAMLGGGDEVVRALEAVESVLLRIERASNESRAILQGQRGPILVENAQ